MRPYALLVLLPLCAACRPASSPTDPPEVTVRLYDYGFEASQDTFTAGQPYRFVLTNEGTVAHEWAVVPRGAETEEVALTEVEEDELPPGAEHEVVFTFPEPGAYDFSCYLEAPVDHHDAGMVRAVTVR